MSLRTNLKYDLGTLGANGEATNMVLSQDFRNATFTINCAGTAGFTIKFYSSNSEDQPDLSSASSATNLYAETQVIDLNDGAGIAGTTGLVVSGDIIKQVEINQNTNRWV